MPPKRSQATIVDEARMEIISLADNLIEKCDELDTLNSKSLAGDYADDEPRKAAVRGLDDLHRGLYGKLTERQHAQVTHILQQISKQEDLDHANDSDKQNERKLVIEIKKTSRALRNAC